MAHGAWLGCSQDEDAAQYIELISEAGVQSFSWLVVDHYGLDSYWEEKLRAGLSVGKLAPRFLAIDDLADRPHRVDLLLDQKFFRRSYQ